MYNSKVGSNLIFKYPIIQSRTEQAEQSQITNIYFEKNKLQFI